MPLLEVNDIHVFYGNIEAIRGVSIQVEPGEMVAILGSNGAGKTTTLRTISGLERTRGGTVVFDGNDISRTPAHQIVERGLCQVPEGRRIFSTLTVLENLNLGGYVYRRRQQEVKARRERVLETFPILAERTGQLAGTLSGGEQQMLAIGRALMNDPKVLTLDEPSLGLSPVLARTILKIVRRFADQGVAVLLVEQNARQALRVADRAYVLETGRIVLEGKAKDLAADERVQRAYLGGFETIAKEEGSEAAS
ncbi:MAG TPA: ABC transporter ATP-binding protein [Candidatus Dormibacteraeota bacterium]